VLVAALATNDEPAIVDLDGDVLPGVDLGQFDSDHGVIAALGDLGGGVEAVGAPLVGDRGTDVTAYPAVDVPGGPCPQRHAAHRLGLHALS
jgi:hypothetical protein